MIRLGVTGTDTGVGKTVVSAALLHAMREAGLRAAGMKPIETGVRDGERGDADRLRDAAGAGDDLSIVRPVRLDAPLAPWVAAEQQGVALDEAAIDEAFRRLASDRDAIVVEGAGGILVPFTATTTVLDWFARWSLDAVIVAPNRLGVINAVRLTQRAIVAAGVRIAAIVLVDQPDPGLAARTNADALQRLTGAPVLGFPHLPDPEDAAALRAAAHRAGLTNLLLQTSRSRDDRPAHA